MRAVVETNVAIAANGLNTHAGIPCQIRCVDFIESLTKSKSKVLLDASGLILDEYKKHLNHRGAPGVGDMFYKFLHDNMYSSNRIEQVAIVPNPDPAKGFDELPENDFDKSDRKFLAVAVKGKGVVVNALDTDWSQGSALVESLKVDVKHLCPEHACVVA